MKLTGQRDPRRLGSTSHTRSKKAHDSGEADD